MNTNRFLPRYLKFANQIQVLINSGQFLPGDKLPPQKELAHQFSTTLMTIRKAIQVLEEDGVIQTEHGVGTFVSDPNLQEEQFQLFSLTNEMKQKPSGLVEIRKIGVNTAVSHAKAAQALRLSENNTVVLLERLRTWNSNPFAYHRSYLPQQYSDVAQSYLPNASLYEALQQATSQDLTMAKEILTPVVLTDGEANRLQTERGTAAWLSQRISSTQSGQPVLYDEALLKPNSFAVTVEHLGKRTNSHLRILNDQSPEIFSFLLEE